MIRLPRTVLPALLSICMPAPALWAQAPAEPAPDPVTAWRAKPPAGAARRIWTPAQQEHQTIWLRRTFEVDDVPTEAEVVVTCDNEADVFVNGVLVATATDWTELLVVEIAGDLVKGENTIAIRARNTGSAAVCVAWVVWRRPNGATDHVATDGDWRCADDVDEAEHPDWCERGFDDDAWGAPRDHGEVRFFCNASGQPAPKVVYRTRDLAAQRLVEEALRDLQLATDDAARLAALDRIERAVMRVRRLVWARTRQQGGQPGTQPRTQPGTPRRPGGRR